MFGFILIQYVDLLGSQNLDMDIIGRSDVHDLIEEEILNAYFLKTIITLPVINIFSSNFHHFV